MYPRCAGGGVLDTVGASGQEGSIRPRAEVDEGSVSGRTSWKSCHSQGRDWKKWAQLFADGWVLYFLTFFQGRFGKSQWDLEHPVPQLLSTCLSGLQMGILCLPYRRDLEKAFGRGTPAGMHVPSQYLLPSAFQTLEVIIRSFLSSQVVV